MKKILTLILRSITIVYVVFVSLDCWCDEEFRLCTQDEINSIQNELNSFKSFLTEFSEESESKTKEGKIYVMKPGLMKIEYEKPKQISIFINKDLVTYYDHELDEITKIKQDPRFLSFLSKNSISLRKDFKGFSCTKCGDRTDLNLDFDDIGDEKIDLELSFLKQKFSSIRIKINNKTRSIIRFKKTNFDCEIDQKIFKFQDKKFFDIEEK